MLRPGLTCVALLLAAGVAGCNRGAPPAGPTSVAAPPQAPLRVLCGSSMAQPVQELGQAFTQAHGTAVEFDLGGSETLLPKVLAGAAADVFVCHDPFEDKVRTADRLAGSVVVGELRPVIVVPPGNPRGIRGVADLARPGLKLGVGDPRYSTCGQMFVERLDRDGLRAAVMANAILQARTHVELANALALGAVDAAVVWNFVVPMYAGKLEAVPTADAYPPVRVTVLGLTNSAAPAARDAFLAYCAAPAARAVFERHGYGAVAASQATSQPAP